MVSRSGYAIDMASFLRADAQAARDEIACAGAAIDVGGADTSSSRQLARHAETGQQQIVGGWIEGIFVSARTGVSGSESRLAQISPQPTVPAGQRIAVSHSQVSRFRVSPTRNRPRDRQRRIRRRHRSPLPQRTRARRLHRTPRFRPGIRRSWWSRRHSPRPRRSSYLRR